MAKIMKKAQYGMSEDMSMMKMGGMKKKAKSGGDFGMLSVKAGVDKNPKPTFADKIAGAKKKATSGTKMMKMGGAAASMVPTMKKGGKAMYGKSMMKDGGKKKMMAGGKCKNGC